MPDSEEVSALARAMNNMAKQLDERMRGVLRQRNEKEAILAGMAEGGMADIVAKAHGLYQILVEKQVAADGSGNPGDELNMQDPVGDMIVSDQAEDLGLVNISRIGLGMKDTVRINSKGCTMP